MNSDVNSNGILIKQLQLGRLMNYVYIVGCRESKEAAVIDPAWDVQAILNVMRNSDFKISNILFTHGHPDHINSVGALLEAIEKNAVRRPISGSLPGKANSAWMGNISNR